ncbi:MAG: hypothetical protein KDE48_02020 [Anaerolineales bacterium]|nr:hypothetical protein [Anaerolineales bacterium]
MIKRLGGIFAFGIIMLAIAGWVNTFQSQDVVGDLTLEVPHQVDVLPDITWLGEGPGTFTVEPGYEFLVKHAGWIEYTIEPPPTYEATAGERVWSINDVEILGYTIYDGAIDFGDIEAGCLVEYVQIDDDIDDRRNTWYINDVPVQVVDQGMVVYGEFIAPESGDLVFFAEDSVGLIDLICPEIVQPTPTVTATETAVPPTETPTDTPEAPTATPTEEGPTATPTATDTPEGPTATPTDTPEGPTATPTDTPEGPTATPTDTPEGPTATPTDVPPTETPIGVPPTETPTEVPPPTITPTDMPPTVTQSPPTPVITATPSPTAKPPREDACLRINFDITGDEAMRGLYVVQEVGGAVYAEWYALDGWQDSGWIRGIDIAYPSVYVQVLYYSGPGAEPVVMKIVNPAPGTEYGWLGRGMCHALEVGWPD